MSASLFSWVSRSFLVPYKTATVLPGKIIRTSAAQVKCSVDRGATTSSLPTRPALLRKSQAHSAQRVLPVPFSLST